MINYRDNAVPVNVGFMGGCINFPNSIEKNRVYHSLLQKALPDIKIKTDIYLTYSELIQASQKFIQRESLDVLFVFVRHFPYMILNKPLIKLYGKNKKSIYRLHPHLMNDSLQSWPKDLDRYVSETRNNKVPRRKYVGWRDMNSILGKILGLHSWAYNYVKNSFIELNRFCISNNIKLVLIGPTKNPETFMGDKICTYLNNKMRSAMLSANIDFIDINRYVDENNNSIFQEDKIHFNVDGHKYLYQKIYKFMQSTVLKAE